MSVTDTGWSRGHDLPMSPRILCSDCPECHTEVVVKLGMTHSGEGCGREALYRINCAACGRAYDVRLEDLSLRDKSEDQIRAAQPVTTFAWR